MRRALGLAIVLVAIATPAWAGPDELAADISSEIMSPFCPGVTLHDCPSESADDLRAQILDWARSGMSRGEILDRLEAEYGPGIRGVPPPEGSGLLAWLAPVAALAAGGALALYLARRWTRRSPATSPDDAISTRDRTRLEAELEQVRAER